MQKWFATYFGFSRSELNGVCVLGLVLLLFWATPRILSFGNVYTEDDFSAQFAEVDSFLATANKRQPSTSYRDYGAKEQQDVHALEVTYFKFDPNGLPVVDWKRLGLSERQIRMIKNYEAKGGHFWKKEDLAKIYAINDTDYARLEPYIDIKQTKRLELPATTASRHDSGMRVIQSVEQPTTLRILHVDLNDADSLELQYLPGIGPVFASRIVRFRDMLGGFHHVSQLMDVYGFDSVRFAGLSQHVYVDTSNVERIALNTAEYQRFRDHPFINHKLANAIVQYRKQHGPYRSIRDLLHIAIMDEQIFLKIAPYLTLADD
ncbi:helix-hairpin-helix domain-containing protein [Parapedobacter sp. 10938]|uniref:helix-hairpin-helix domain-containing protein n=1 Tax=Parapedobacter flavus TaxID=3110225 RepID=UPI002DB5955B|nr:helix-hairpin-helix domain-containing protein [Parapedobacter sp. 10938]MEC3880422.1 helix-hairpin-helix domain-containing protein [Parapedobacter sp. 10938]